MAFNQSQLTPAAVRVAGNILSFIHNVQNLTLKVRKI